MPPRTPLDKLDLYILTLLSEQPLWKKRVHTMLTEHGPHDLHPSLQTIGRRIDALRDKELVETQVVQPDDTPRQVVIAFKTLEYGRETVDQYAVCSTCDEVVPPWKHTHSLTAVTHYFDA